MAPITLDVNGQKRQVNVAPDTPLLWVLCDELGLTGTKYGCGSGYCGACTVHLDGKATRSCQTPLSLVNVFDCLIEAGFSPAEAQLAYTTFESCMFGRMAVERAHRAPVSTDKAYRWAFDTLIAGFEARINAARTHS